MEYEVGKTYKVVDVGGYGEDYLKGVKIEGSVGSDNSFVVYRVTHDGNAFSSSDMCVGTLGDLEEGNVVPTKDRATSADNADDATDADNANPTDDRDVADPDPDTLMHVVGGKLIPDLEEALEFAEMQNINEVYEVVVRRVITRSWNV